MKNGWNTREVRTSAGSNNGESAVFWYAVIICTVYGVILVRTQYQSTEFFISKDSLYLCLLTFIHHSWLYLIISNRSGDIERNPGPKPNSSQSFLFLTRI